MTPRKTPRRTTRKGARKASTKSARKSPRPAAKKPARQATARRGAGTSAASGSVVAQLEGIERDGGVGDVSLGRGVKLHVSSLGKLYFPDAGVTKGALMRYYAQVAPVLLPQLDGRPLVLKRYPEGIAGEMFFQQDAGPHVPDVVRVQALDTEEKGKRMRIIGGDLATLLYTVQLGAIEVHPWLSRVTDIDAPDRCLIDLDPDDEVPFPSVVALAGDILRIVEECGLSAAVKTSGSTGMHVVLPLPPGTSYETSVRLASRIAELTVTLRPTVATVERSIHGRPSGSIYVDAMQNARGKSAASAYSVRARKDATVSTPVEPGELTSRLRMSAFTVRTVPARIARKGDIWGSALEGRPTARALTRALQMLEDALDAPAKDARAPRARKRGRAGGRDAGAGDARRPRGRAHTTRE
ncbi:MAG TPA: non-homologous end-joining DNA ligase [Gemmatimonadaceae bacterium]|nr:non-homologous end-joining DNA ligase [Gemmatimonadaceae bacterium]